MGDESFIGAIATFAGHFAPRGWMDCAGQKLPVAHHEALFSIIGTVYGGDGLHEFALPDLRPEVDGRKVDWSVIYQPRQCICIEGLFPPRD
jgi:microcystin-dependent protein